MPFPACLAAAALRAISGEEFFKAIILGIEVAGRLARWYVKRTRNGLWLTTSVIGGFGAVAAAGHILGLTDAQRAEAWGLNYAAVSGNRQALIEHALSKRLQPANAARGAVWACLLAQEGLTGAHGWIEGEGGLLRLYAGNDDASGFDCVARPDIDRWEIENDIIKRYPTCGAHHPVMHAAIELARIQGVDAAEIEKIQMFIEPAAVQLVGGVFACGEHPQTDAQFSAAYGVAAALKYAGFGLAQVQTEAVRADKAVHDLAARVEYLQDWTYSLDDFPIGSDYGPNLYKPQYVRCVLKDGTVFENACTRIPVFIPFIARDISESDLHGKFADCSEYAGVSERAAQEMYRSLESLASERDVHAVIARDFTDVV